MKHVIDSGVFVNRYQLTSPEAIEVLGGDPGHFCGECEFVSKSAKGLATHRGVKHKKMPQMEKLPRRPIQVLDPEVRAFVQRFEQLREVDQRKVLIYLMLDFLDRGNLQRKSLERLEL